MTYANNKKYIQDTIHGGFDISYREISVENNKYFLCFLNSLCDSKLMSELIKGLYIGSSCNDIVSMYPSSIVECQFIEQGITPILSGQCLLLYLEKIFLIEVRQYPNKASNEAQNEQSIRGSHDGFVENIIMNVGLLRRRIRDPKLQVKLLQVGQKSKTDIAYLYIEDSVDINVLIDFKKRFNKMNPVEVIYERTICDALYGKSYNPYPYIRFSERPDICAIHLLQGYIILLVDNSFTAIIIPTTFFELTKQIEEYTQTSLVALLIRCVRLLAIFLSIYFLPFYLLVQTTNNPTTFSIPIMEQMSKELLLFQVLVIEIIIEWIRLSFIHTPQSISGIMSFLFVFLLGESAINMNLYTDVILVFVVLCNICNFVTPNYELSLANKTFRILISISTILFGLIGFSVSILFHYFILMQTKTIHTSYLYPIIPFDYKEIKRLLLGSPIKVKKAYKK